MKKILFFLFLAGCASAQATQQPDAGMSVHAENQYKWYYDKYQPACVRHCMGSTGSPDCPEKCDKDFLEIKRVLLRAIRDNREDDFAEMMDSWYGQD